MALSRKKAVRDAVDRLNRAFLSDGAPRDPLDRGRAALRNYAQNVHVTRQSAEGLRDYLARCGIALPPGFTW